MCEAQLPELSTDEDLDYMRSKFLLGKDNELAAVEFRRLIHVSLNACVASIPAGSTAAAPRLSGRCR